MLIKKFYKVIESVAVPRSLRDTTVVVDGSNFFFQTYERSGLSYAFGCESDRYAAYLRDYILGKFNKANITCYFLFNGGKQYFQKSMSSSANIKRPIFTKNIIMEVIKENNYEHVICEYENKREIIELAEYLDCPIISYDVGFCFSGLRYIPGTLLRFEKSNSSIECGQFLLANFQQRYNLTADKIATFIVLTDQRIYPYGFFTKLFNSLKAPLGHYKRILHLLRWLSKSNRDHISETISMFLSADEKVAFIEKETKECSMIGRRESGGLGAAYLLDRSAADIARADPRWFAKGVALGHVCSDYVNLYRSKHFYGSHAPADCEQEDAMIPSLPILKYAYDLLTNFKNDGFHLVIDTQLGKEKMLVGSEYSVRKPAYEAETCVFENGWGSVRGLGLLEHFVREALSTSLRRLERAPEEARLPLLALAYFSRRRPAAPRALPAAALLTYVALDLLPDKADSNDLPRPPFDRRPIVDSTTDKNDVTEEDRGIAAAIMRDYYTVSGVEPIDVKLLHPLAEFQQCLLQLSGLNALCGAELRAPVFSRTYNGPLAYKLLRAADQAADLLTFMDDLLSPAPTFYAFFNGLFEIYNKLL